MKTIENILDSVNKFGDTETIFRLMLKDGDDYISLNNKHVVLNIANSYGLVLSVPLTDQVGDTIELDFKSEELSKLTPDAYKLEFEVTTIDGDIAKFPTKDGLPFHITNNLKQTQGTLIPTITFDEVLSAVDDKVNEYVHTIKKGDKGDKGDTGSQGVQGIQGERGEQGEQGPQGVQGVAGKDFSIADIHQLKNKKIVMFGDSIIDLGTIPSEIKTLSEATEVYNVGFAGCTMTPTDTIGGGYDKFSMHSLATAVLANDFTAQTTLATTTLSGFLAHLNTLKSIDFSTIDICFISYGTNDFGYDVNSGTADVASNLTVAGAMKDVVNKLQSKNPNMEIVFTTPIYRADKFLNKLNLPLSVYADTIKGTAGRLGIKVIDLHTVSGINEFNYTTLLKATDKLHPVAAGNTLMAKAIVQYARGGYVGRTDNKFEPLTVGVNLAQDSEKFNVHNPSNIGAFYGGKSYITHAPKSYMKYTDIVLCDSMIELTGFTTIKIVFDAIIKGSQGRVDAILYDSENTAVVTKVATLNINATEANYVTNHVMGNFTGVYRLYVAIKAMDIAPEIYIRNPLILQKNYEKISVGATTVTVSGSPLSVMKSVIYNDYNNWPVDYIPVVMANSQYTDLIVSVANFYNHFEVTITTKKGVGLTAGDYVINYVRFLT